MNDFKKGDRVRIEVEAEVIVANLYELYVKFDSDGRYRYVGYDVATKIEPPIETFCPGDRVRDKILPKHEYTLGKDGWFSHNSLRYMDDDEPFTSERYELVSRG